VRGFNSVYKDKNTFYLTTNTTQSRKPKPLQTSLSDGQQTAIDK
jgi:hypothetical protein